MKRTATTASDKPLITILHHTKIVNGRSKRKAYTNGWQQGLANVHVTAATIDHFGFQLVDVLESVLVNADGL